VDRSLRVNLEKESANDLPPSPDCPTESCSHRKRDGSILMQQNARVDLKVISQASGVPLSGLPGYAYDSRGGRGISVYVMDTGIDPSHPVSVKELSMVKMAQSVHIYRNSEIC